MEIFDMSRHLPTSAFRIGPAWLLATVLGSGWAAPVMAQESPDKLEPAPAIRLYTLDCGLTEFKDADVFSDTGEYAGKYMALPTPCYLIRHGSDWLLWDTGLSDKLAAEPHGKEIFGGRFSVKRTLASQLAALGVKPDQITYVGLSHLHFDHTGNIGLFSKSTFLIAADELAAARAKKPPFGVDPASIAPLAKRKVEAFDLDHDVFGDGSVTMLTTPGHTKGHCSLLVKLPKSGPVLITGDLYHTRLNYEQGLIPRINQRADTLASADRFKRLQKNMKARVVIQHAPEDFAAMPAFPEYLE
jgi:glyoxylase-like metal-dependent hydrolase (beta-lactamase superfamily II)